MTSLLKNMKTWIVQGKEKFPILNYKPQICIPSLITRVLFGK